MKLQNEIYILVVLIWPNLDFEMMCFPTPFEFLECLTPSQFLNQIWVPYQALSIPKGRSRPEVSCFILNSSISSISNPNQLNYKHLSVRSIPAGAFFFSKKRSGLKKWCHSRTECKSSFKMLILLCVFEGDITVDGKFTASELPGSATGSRPQSPALLATP